MLGEILQQELQSGSPLPGSAPQTEQRRWKGFVVPSVALDFVALPVVHEAAALLQEVVIAHHVHLGHLLHRNVLGTVPDAIATEFLFVDVYAFEAARLDLTFGARVFR